MVTDDRWMVRWLSIRHRNLRGRPHSLRLGRPRNRPRVRIRASLALELC